MEGREKDRECTVGHGEGRNGGHAARYMRKGRNNKIKIKVFTKAKLYMLIVLTVLCVISLFTIFTIDIGGVNMGAALRQFGINLRDMFLRPRLSGRETFLEVLGSLAVSLSIALMTTLAGGFVALFLAFFTAENLSDRKVARVIRIAVSFFRAVPTILWVMVFSVVATIGVEAAVIGISFHSVAYLVKAYSESIEELDSGIIEGLKASGASKWQIIFQAVIPSAMTSILSWTFVRFEINFTNAVVVGAASGAGGIGYEMFMAGNMYHDLREVGVFAYLILITAIILEIISYILRSKYIVNKL